KTDYDAFDEARHVTQNSYWAKYADIGYYAYAIRVVGENYIVNGLLMPGE
ncbi:MAG: hypothetical protein RI897_3848, partial [Verrucomicrobiota bacterium]